MGRPFIRRLPRKEGDRFYVCRFCRTPIASALGISAAAGSTITRETFRDLCSVNVHTPNPPKKCGRQGIQEVYCTHCNKRLGRKSIQLRRKQKGAEFSFGGAMPLRTAVPVTALAPHLIGERDDQEPHDGIEVDASSIVAEPSDDDNDDDGIKVDPNYIVEVEEHSYICRTCYNEIASTHDLCTANYSPPGSGLAGGLFDLVINVEGYEIRDVDHYTITDVHCIRCCNHLGWHFVEVRNPPQGQFIIFSGDYLMIMDRLMILIVDDDD